MVRSARVGGRASECGGGDWGLGASAMAGALCAMGALSAAAVPAVAERRAGGMRGAAAGPVALAAAPRAAGSGLALALGGRKSVAMGAVAEMKSGRAGFSYEDFEAALSGGKYTCDFKSGDRVTGTIFQVDNKRGVYVDCGAKTAAFCPITELGMFAVDDAADVAAVGDVREFQIVRDMDAEGVLGLSVRRLQTGVAWERCRQLMAEDVTVVGAVVAANRGGILVVCEGIRGFIPTSHVSVRVQDKEQLVGMLLPMKFLEVDEERTRLVMSNRRAVVEADTRSFELGQVVEGTVTAVKPYGAFLDLGGTNGLLHISQISHEHIGNVESVLSEGDVLKVMVVSQDPDKGRIALSTKRLEPEPGDMLKDPKKVYDNAEKTAEAFRAQLAAEEAELMGASDDE